ncbi:hypothetical protein FRIGORI9N_60001 [Frigoribacterium sp. 9N]|nr:hypothetical protein FRIGORI9N_60001 [Frigoribacterium sp. 9N]
MHDAPAVPSCGRGEDPAKQRCFAPLGCRGPNHDAPAIPRLERQEEPNGANEAINGASKSKA